MDECESLCTRLVIMVNGQFKCIGTPQFLRSHYGSGYTLTIKTTGEPQSQWLLFLFPFFFCFLLIASLVANAFAGDVEPVRAHVEQAFAQAKLEEVHRGYLHYQLPATSVSSLAAAFGVLEDAKTQLGIENYELSQTSLEEVFCKVPAVGRRGYLCTSHAVHLCSPFLSPPVCPDAGLGGRGGTEQARTAGKSVVQGRRHTADSRGLCVTASPGSAVRRRPGNRRRRPAPHERH
jgi:hypothetical protein